MQTRKAVATSTPVLVASTEIFFLRRRHLAKMQSRCVLSIPIIIRVESIENIFLSWRQPRGEFPNSIFVLNMFISRLTSDRNIKFNDNTVRSQSILLCTKKHIIVKLIWILYYESINIQLKGSPFLDVIACHMFARIFHTYYGFIFYRHLAYIIMTVIWLMVLVGPGIYEYLFSLIMGNPST